MILGRVEVRWLAQVCLSSDIGRSVCVDPDTLPKGGSVMEYDTEPRNALETAKIHQNPAHCVLLQCAPSVDSVSGPRTQSDLSPSSGQPERAVDTSNVLTVITHHHSIEIAGMFGFYQLRKKYVERKKT